MKSALEDIARRWVALWQGGNLDGFEGLHAPEFVDRSTAGRGSTREAFRQGIEDLYRSFPDFSGGITGLVAEGASPSPDTMGPCGRVALAWSAQGTHKGPFMGRSPTHQAIHFEGIEIIRVSGGRLVERWGEWNGIEILHQIDSFLARVAAPRPRHVLTILAVSDLDAASRFYREAFGWPARVAVPVYVEFELPDGRGLGLYRRDGFARNTGAYPEPMPGGGISSTELYFHVLDLDSIETRLLQSGARQLSPRAHREWGDEASYFTDPDGNVLVVARPL